MPLPSLHAYRLRVPGIAPRRRESRIFQSKRSRHSFTTTVLVEISVPYIAHRATQQRNPRRRQERALPAVNERPGGESRLLVAVSLSGCHVRASIRGEHLHTQYSLLLHVASY